MNKCIENSCSECCEDINLILATEPDEDIKRWIEFHGIKVTGNMINIKNKCEKLVDGQCSIYMERPFNCSNFYCDDYGK